MSESNRCPECGCELPAGALSGLCPQCLLKAGLKSQSEVVSGVGTESPPVAESQPKPPESGFVPPSAEELKNVIPQIEIVELLGKGGMGAVYKGRQISLDRIVAVKILPPEIGRDPAFSERFAREARALGRLNHPNIVHVHDTGSVNGMYYLVMEYVDGLNLRQLLVERKLPPKEALAIVPQVCDALQFAHEEGIVHRDIKPENILIDKRGRVKIADFGLAKLLGQEHPDANLTLTNQVMGTIKYMAPEQMAGSRDIDHRADIYSLGVVFYELLTGELPLGRFAPPSKMVQIDVRLDEIVLRTLEREPEQRYQHAGDVKTHVESVVRTPAGASSHAREAAQKLAGEAKVHADRFSAAFRRWIADLPELDRPWVRRVGLPTLGFVMVAVYAAIMTFLTAPPHHAGDAMAVGLFLTGLLFVILNVVWFVQRSMGMLVPPSPDRWPAEDIARQLRGARRNQILVGVLTFLGWILMAPLGDIPANLAIGWALIAGIVPFFAAKAIGNHRDPGTLSLLVGIVPVTPAVVLGLPAAVQTLRLLVRPEVQAFIASSAQERPAPDA